MKVFAWTMLVAIAFWACMVVWAFGASLVTQDDDIASTAGMLVLGRAGCR